MTQLRSNVSRPAKKFIAATGLLTAIMMINVTVTSAAAAPLRIVAELPGLLPDASVATVDSRTGIVYVIDQREVSLPAGCEPRRFALDTVGDQLLIVGKGCDAVTLVDTDDLTVSTIPGDFSDAVALDVTRRVLFASNALTGKVRSFNADSHRMERDVSGFASIEEIVLDLDHYRLFLLSGPVVLEWDVRDSSATSKFSHVQDSVIDIDFDRSSQTLFFLSRMGTLTTIDRSGSAIRPERTSGFTRPSSMALDAFAGSTYVLCPRDGTIRVARS